VQLDQIHLVLVLAEELHFGRTAARLRVSQARVSKQIAALERKLGGALFDRTSRRVRLTPLGRRFLDEVGPAYHDLLAAIDRLTSEDNRELRVGVIPTTGGTAITRLIREYERRHPDAGLRLQEIPYDDPFGALRDADIDILVLWRVTPGPGVTTGPAIDRQDRIAVMSIDHPLATRDSISVVEVDNWAQPVNVGLPAEILTTFLPPATNDGTPIPRIPLTFTSLPEMLTLIAGNKITHASVTSFAEYANRDDITFVPIHDLPALDLVLYWWTAHETDAVRAFARTARSVFPPSAGYRKNR
jgi:DNA-binding transcriptional LysR family regulator